MKKKELVYQKVFDNENYECPVCGTEELDYGSYSPEDDMFTQDVKCLNEKCGASFEIWADKPQYWSVENLHMPEKSKKGKR